jgi:hypothetical protein
LIRRRLAAAALLLVAAAAGGYAGGLVAAQQRPAASPELDPVTARERSELTVTAVRADLSSVVVVDGQVVPPLADDHRTPGAIARSGLDVLATVPASQLHRLPAQLSTVTVRLPGGAGADCAVVSFAANVGPDGGADPQLRCRLDPRVATYVGLAVQIPVAGLTVQGQVVPRYGPEGHDPAGRVIARSGLDVVATVPASQLHRMPAEITTLAVRIQDGPIAECAFISFAANLGPDGGADPQLRCRLDPEVTTYVGLAAQIAVTVATVADVVVLPLTAVDGSAGTGQVYLRTGPDTWQWQRVGLGINDGRRVQITSGLSPGDVVADPVPSIFGGRP